jgi:hypothetical protein
MLSFGGVHVLPGAAAAKDNSLPVGHKSGNLFRSGCGHVP